MINPFRNTLRAIAAATALSTIGFTAQAANVNIVDTTGTANITNVATATDGATPPNFTDWTTDSAYWIGFDDTLTLKFDKAYYLSSLSLTVDWNDYYKVSVSTDGISYVELGTYTGIGSPVNWGQVTLPIVLTPSATAFSFAKVTAVIGGDELNSVGEISFQGIAAAVPEPETYAMMLAGLGALGFIGKRRRAS